MRKSTLNLFLTFIFVCLGTINLFAHDVTVYLKKSDGTPYVNVMVRYQLGSSGTTDVGVTDSFGKVVKTGISGANHRFSATVNSTTFTTAPMTVNNDTEITIYTSAVVINSFNSNSLPLADVTSYFLGSSTINLGTSTASGTITAELFPGSRPIRSHYKGTSNTQTITVSGDGYTPGISTILNTYTSEVKFIASSHNNEKVSGVGIRYTAGGSTTNQNGTTDANGERTLELYPGSYPFHGLKNGTTQNWSVTINGDGTLPGNQQTESVLFTRVKFYNSGTVRYNASGSTYTISGNDYYMFPGDYTLLFNNNNYSRTVSISGTNFERAAAVIILKDSSGNLTPINSIRGGIGSSISYHVSSTNGGYHVSNESPAVWIDISNYNANTSRIYEVTKNGTISTQSQDLIVNNIFNFQTLLLTLRLQKCNADGISGGSIRWGFSATGTPTITSHWASYPVTSNQTDASGNTSLDVFSGNFIFEMNYASSQQIKGNLALSNNTTVTWQTTNVKFHYKGTGSSIAYGLGAPNTWWTYPTNGQELLPGLLKFNFVDNGANLMDVTIPEQCSFEKTVVIARLLNSAGAPLSGGTVSYYESAAWQNVTNPTAANGNTVYLLNGNPATTTVTMNHLGTSNQKNNVNLVSVNYVVVFQTVLITMTLVDKNDNPIEADSGTLQYYANGWKVFGSGNTTGGSETMELLPTSSSYSFQMRLNGTIEQKNSWNMITTPIIPFKASKVWIHYKDSNCAPKSGVAATFYAQSWRSMGVTDANGNSNMIDMLPGGSYSFKAGTLPQKNGIVIQGIGVDQIVEFEEGDTLSPQITTCPPNYSIEGCGVNAITGLLYSETPVVVSMVDFNGVGGVASDNCSITTYSYSDVKSSTDCVVTVTRTWVIKDAAGNSKVYVQQINVKNSRMISNPMIRSRVK